jgi:ATP-dependent Clp protease ATP-binding subunit ClpA
LTDSKGVTVDFSNTLVVMTSNVAAHEIAAFTTGKDEQAIGAGWDELSATVMERLKQHFKPEFLNRIDDIVVFHTLTHGQVQEIARLQMQAPAERLKAQQVELEVTEAAYSLLAELGYDVSFGARPMRRAIMNNVINPVAGMVISGELPPGSTVVVDAADGEFSFNVRSGG